MTLTKIRKNNIYFIILLFMLLNFFVFPGCSSSKSVKKESMTTSIEDDNQNRSGEDYLSYGMVTSKVEKNVTTQEEILKLFGAPNITTIDSNGDETWVYEKCG